MRWLLACSLLVARGGVAAHRGSFDDADAGEESGNSAGDKKSRPQIGPQIAGAHLAKMMGGYDAFIAPGNALAKPEATIVKVSLGVMAIHAVNLGT
jgi:hypothetical protein